MRRLWHGLVAQQVGFIPACFLVTGALSMNNGQYVFGALAFGAAAAAQVVLYRP